MSRGVSTVTSGNERCRGILRKTQALRHERIPRSSGEVQPGNRAAAGVRHGRQLEAGPLRERMIILLTARFRLSSACPAFFRENAGMAWTPETEAGRRLKERLGAQRLLARMDLHEGLAQSADNNAAVGTDVSRVIAGRSTAWMRASASASMLPAGTKNSER